MTSEWVTKLAGELLWTGFLVSVPLLGLTTAVGVLASILQVVTQVSEAALSFVPKLVAAGIGLVLFGPWMLRNAIGMPETPPNPAVIGIALFLTLFTMSPVLNQVNSEAFEPFMGGAMQLDV